MSRENHTFKEFIMKKHTFETVREYLKLSKKDFSHNIGISPNAYTNYIAGKRIIPTDVAIKIKQLYDISIDWLLTGKGNMKLDVSDEKKNINNGHIVMNGNGNFISGDIKVNESDFDTKNKVKEVFGLMKYAPPAFIDNIKNKLLEFKKFSEL